MSRLLKIEISRDSGGTWWKHEHREVEGIYGSGWHTWRDAIGAAARTLEREEREELELERGRRVP